MKGQPRFKGHTATPYWCSWCGNDTPDDAYGSYCGNQCLDYALADAKRRREEINLEIMTITAAKAMRRKRSVAA